MGHSSVDHRFAGFGQLFIVFAQPTIATQPSERAFDDPTAREHLKSLDIITPLDDLKDPVAGMIHPFDQLAGIPTISPDQPQMTEAGASVLQHPLGSVSIPLRISRISCSRGCPPDLGGGTKGSRMCHWASVRSLEYDSLFITQQSTQHWLHTQPFKTPS